MPQPTWTLTPWLGSFRGFLKFGGRPLPLIGTNMNYVDLNDGVSWFVENVSTTQSKLLGTKPYMFQEEGAWISEDSSSRAITITSRYDEGPGTPFAQAKALLSQAGEQYLTTDNVTAILCKLVSIGSPVLIAGSVPPYVFKTDLSFLAVNPYAQDIAATVVSAFAVAGSSGAGTDTNFSTNPYAGSVRGKPVFTLTIPVGNTATISQIKLTNLTTGRILTVVFSPVLPASTAIVITIDTGAWTVKDGSGNFYDPVGSFPLLAPPAGTVNSWRFNIVSNVGTTGVTLGYTYNNRWEF